MCEGHFVQGKLEGFGRKISVYPDGRHYNEIGFFSEGKLHGYGKSVDSAEGSIEVGLFEHDQLVNSKDITAYKLTDFRANEIDFD